MRDGVYTEVSLEEYLGRVTPGEGGERRTHVTLLDLAGSAAVAPAWRSRPASSASSTTSLLRVDGRWQIVNKIFDRSPLSGS